MEKKPPSVPPIGGSFTAPSPTGGVGGGFSIYTGKGDAGMTSLAGGHRVPKTHPRLEAFGTIDELNASIGLLITEIEDEATLELLLFIQSKLFDVGSCLATDSGSADFSDDCVKKIEEAIDHIDSRLPKMKAFVLPGGSRPAALAHVCRTVCRRAERAIFRLAETEKIEANIFVFINRLSDLLFVIARKECAEKKVEEKFWDNSCK